MIHLPFSIHSFLRLVGFALIAMFFLPSCFASDTITQRPNIIFIMSDDHTSQAISAYGGRLAQVCPTPNIDRLAKEGMLFKNCFVTNAICTPSRAAILTGKYAHKNGVYKFTALDQRQPTLPKLLQQAGYQTALIGKYHLHSNPAGLDYFSILPGQGEYHDPEFIRIGDEHPSGWVAQGKRTVFQGHSSDVIADQTLDYLKSERYKEEPYMLFCHFKAPHDPWQYATRYQDFLSDTDIPEPDNLLDDYKGRSDALQLTSQHLEDIAVNWSDPEQLEKETQHLQGKAKIRKLYQTYMKSYLRCVKGVDDNVGRILDYLDEAGLAENTIVMYTGDQGFFLGEHGLYDKRFMYEESLRMPLLIRWPANIKPGSVSEGMVLNVDFAPTILEAAGSQAHPQMQGRSFLPLLEGKQPADWRQSMYYRYYFSHFETEPHYGVRTYQHKLIYFDRIQQWELYDLEKDPQEMLNVYEEEAYAPVVTALKKEIKRLQAVLDDRPDDTGDHPDLGELAPAPLYVSKNVQLGKGNVTLLIRFRTGVGGTLFSVCNLEADVYQDAFSRQGIKTLFIHEGQLVYNDGEESDPIADRVADGQWHTLGLVWQDRQPYVYLDGQPLEKNLPKISQDEVSYTFNIGAGLDESGFMGYNFQGNISHVLYYDTPLTQEVIKAFAQGKMPQAKASLQWDNEK